MRGNLGLSSGVRLLVGFVALALMAVALIPEARAESQVRRNDTVTSRARPQYDPVGVRLRSFFFYPKLNVTEKYDDNIFAVSTRKKSDYITIISPRMRLNSNWGQHQLNFFGEADIGRYVKSPNENYNDFRVGTNGRLDIRHDRNLFGRAVFQRLHEQRGNPNAVAGVEPTVYHSIVANPGYFHQISRRFSAKVEGNFRYLNFDDAPAAVGNIDQDDRDRFHGRGSLRVGYEINPRIQGFIRGSYNIVRYRLEPDNEGFDRNSHGFAFVGGTKLDFTGKLFGEIFLGYRQQDFDEARFAKIQGFGAGTKLTWNPSGLTTVKLSIVRDINESTLVAASGFFATRVESSVDHELRRNVIVSAGGAFELQDYRGITRTDKTFGPYLRVRYLIHRHLFLQAGYQLQRRASKALGANYTRNSFTLKIETQF